MQDKMRREYRLLGSYTHPPNAGALALRTIARAPTTLIVHKTIDAGVIPFCVNRDRPSPEQVNSTRKAVEPQVILRRPKWRRGCLISNSSCYGHQLDQRSKTTLDTRGGLPRSRSRLDPDHLEHPCLYPGDRRVRNRSTTYWSARFLPG